MSAEHSEHETFIKTPRQLINIILLSFVVPVVVIIMLASYFASTPTTGSVADAMTDEAISARIRPVAGFELAAAGGVQGMSTPPSLPATAASTSMPASARPNVAAAPAAQAPAPVAAAPAAAPAATAAPAAPAADTVQVAAAPAATPAIYAQFCSACHAAGVGGAPRYDDKAAWEPRIAKGIDALTATVISGKGAMPPRGLAMQASDEEIKTAVQYMVAKAQAN